MKPEHSNFAVYFDNKILTIHIDGKLVLALPKEQLGNSVLEILFLNMKRLIREPLFATRPFDLLAFPFQVISVGPCTICGRHANLLGGLCYYCCPRETVTDEKNHDD